MEALRIRNWNKHYETNKTRILKTLNWLALPVALDNDGYAELMEHENGAAHFGVFVALLEVAARGVPRGTLLRARNVPHDALSLARVCRIPAPTVQEAVTRLLNIGWIETWHTDALEVPGKRREMDDTLPVLPGGPVLHNPTDITGNTGRGGDAGRGTEEGGGSATATPPSGPRRTEELRKQVKTRLGI